MQQLAEELRAEFMEEKRAAARGPSCAAHRSRHQIGGSACQVRLGYKCSNNLSTFNCYLAVNYVE